MANVNPLLLVGAVIGVVTALLVFAYASVKDKKGSMGFAKQLLKRSPVQQPLTLCTDVLHYTLGSFSFLLKNYMSDWLLHSRNPKPTGRSAKISLLLSHQNARKIGQNLELF